MWFVLVQQNFKMQSWIVSYVCFICYILVYMKQKNTFWLIVDGYLKAYFILNVKNRGSVSERVLNKIVD